MATACTSSASEQSPGFRALDGLPIVEQTNHRYYEAFPLAARGGWTDAGFFPIGTWFSSLQTPGDVEVDRAVGLNTYFHLTDNSDLRLLEDSGFSALLARPFDRRAPQVVGHVLGDEIDMKGGPGFGPATPGAEDQPQPCATSGDRCGYSVMASSKQQSASAEPGAIEWANYGKGVAFWETDDEAAKFVNDFTDVVSTDVYWYSDPDVCGTAENSWSLPEAQCRRAANYGAIIDRQRELDRRDGREQPIFAFVETGTPGEGWNTILPRQAAGAVMSSIIHGARGVVYFNHNFGGPCRSENALRDCDPPMQAALSEVNRQVRDLAPALNVPAREFFIGDDVDATLRTDGESVYIVAMAKGATGSGERTLRLPETLRDWMIRAPYEDRTLARTGADTFMDSFADESSYHIYRLEP